MAQHDYDLANANGATFRSDVNAALNAIATANSGATAPTTTFAFMWWFDTANNLLKIRNSSNSAWVTVASLAAGTWIPYRAGSAIGTGALLITDTNTSLTANSDANVATQKAVKAYVDAQISALAALAFQSDIADEFDALTEKSTLHDNDLLVIEDSEAAGVKKKVTRGNLAPAQDFRLIDSEALSNTADSKAFTIAPNGLYMMHIEVENESNNNDADLKLRFNGDTGSNYDYYLRAVQPASGTPTTNEISDNSDTGIHIGGIRRNSGASFYRGQLWIDTYKFNSTRSAFVWGRGYGNRSGAAAGSDIMDIGGSYIADATIASMLLHTDGSGTMTGSIQLYEVSQS